MHLERTRVVAGSVRKLLRRSAYSHVANLLVKLHPGDISNIMAELNERDQLSVFSVLMKSERELAAETLSSLGIDRSLNLLKSISPGEVAKVLQELETDDRADFIAALPDEIAEEVLEKMGLEESVEVQGLLQYEEETAGRIMTPNVFALHEDLSVAEAIHTIQTTQELEMVFYLYVTDDRNHLVGVASLRQLLTVAPSTPLKKVMTIDVIAVRTETDQEEVSRQVALYDLLAIPVVDHENKLVGMITVDDVIDVIKDEATEDILHLAGVEADDHIHAGAVSSVRKRLPWLAVNLVMALAAATIVAMYEPTIAAVPILAMFLPVVAGMGGNSGTQALTVTVRGLALGEISWKNTRSIVLKEMGVGIANGVVIGLLAGLMAFAWKGNYLLGAVLGGALITNIFVSGAIGALVPIVLRSLNVDPAIASGIFLHTLTDVVGFFTFLALAAALLL
jgi:magnesium transporter